MITPTTELAFILEEQALSGAKSTTQQAATKSGSRQQYQTTGRIPLGRLNASSASSSPSMHKAQVTAANNLRRGLEEALQPLRILTDAAHVQDRK